MEYLQITKFISNFWIKSDKSFRCFCWIIGVNDDMEKFQGHESRRSLGSHANGEQTISIFKNTWIIALEVGRLYYFQSSQDVPEIGCPRDSSARHSMHHIWISIDQTDLQEILQQQNRVKRFFL